MWEETGGSVKGSRVITCNLYGVIIMYYTVCIFEVKYYCSAIQCVFLRRACTAVRNKS